MRTNIQLLLLLVLLVFSSCETLIQIETPETLDNITVESNITTQNQYWELKITSSQAYYNQSDASGVENAIVYISDDLGNTDTLEHQAEGLFRSKEPKSAIAGRTYHMTIEYNGELFEASEYCRFQNSIDTFTAYFLPENNGFIEKGWYAFQQSIEWEEEGDYYEWMIYKNDTLQDQFGFILDEDQNRDVSFFNMGIDQEDPLSGIDQGILPRPFPFTFNPGDTIIMDQYCISEGYYNYLLEVQAQLNRTGGPFDPPPANPVSNISNGAYGYFSVRNIVTAQTVIPE